MAVRRSAFKRIGPFDEAIGVGGDEEDWLLALRAAGGSIMYLAQAGLDHRRAGADARLAALVGAAYRRGRAARMSDQRRGRPPRSSSSCGACMRCSAAYRSSSGSRWSCVGSTSGRSPR